MALLTRDELRQLTETQTGKCVSLFMPTHRAGPETQQDPIRLKNLLRQAEEHLIAAGVRSAEAQRILAPAKKLLNDVFFWQHQRDGLALFLSASGLREYRVPLSFDELVVVNDRFHVKPLLALLAGDGRFFILALSLASIRLFEASRHSMTEIKLEGFPTSIDEALKYDDFEQSFQFHSAGAVGTPGGQPTVFHGQGGERDIRKDNIQRFFRQVDNGLQPILKNERAPLVLAGVDYLHPIFHAASTYKHILPEGITGNPELLRPEELHREAWRIVESHFEQAQRDAEQQYHQLAGTGLASSDLREIIPAAFQGRVDILFVPTEVQQWGVFKPDTNAVELHEEPGPNDEDLLNVAAVQTFLNSGMVYAVPPDQLPDNAPAAAVFRY